MNSQLEIKLDTPSISIRDFRLPDPHYKNVLKRFAEVVQVNLDCEVAHIDFAKQDSRGSLSITVFDKRHCVPMQKYFTNKWELLGYVDGYLTANDKAKYL